MTGLDVRFGSKAVLTAPKSDFSFTPENGLNSDIAPCPKSAKKRHFKTQNNIEPFCRRTKVIPG
jgi:hypothetical protein